MKELKVLSAFPSYVLKQNGCQVTLSTDKPGQHRLNISENIKNLLKIE